MNGDKIVIELNTSLHVMVNVVVNDFEFVESSIDCDDERPLRGLSGAIVDWRVTNPYRLFVFSIPDLLEPGGERRYKKARCTMYYDRREYNGGEVVEVKRNGFDQKLYLTLRFPITALEYFKAKGILDYFKAKGYVKEGTAK